MLETTPRRLRIAAATGLCLAVSLVGGVPATASEPVQLGGQNMVTGPVSGTRVVRLATEAEVTWQSFPMGAHDGMVATGDGRAIGFALEPVANDPADPRYVMRARLGWCDTPGCPVAGDPMYCGGCSWLEGGRSGFEDRVFTWPDNTVDHRVVLPPGEYLLTLIADGKPIGVDFILYEPFSGTPLAGVSETTVEPDPSRVAMTTEIGRGAGYWEATKNFTTGQSTSFWFVAGWEHVDSTSSTSVWGPAWLCDHPGGRSLTSPPCPATPDRWVEEGNVTWRGSGPYGFGVIATADPLLADETHGLTLTTVVGYSNANVSRGFLTIQLVT